MCEALHRLQLKLHLAWFSRYLSDNVNLRRNIIVGNMGNCCSFLRKSPRHQQQHGYPPLNESFEEVHLPSTTYASEPQNLGRQTSHGKKDMPVDIHVHERSRSLSEVRPIQTTEAVSGDQPLPSISSKPQPSVPQTLGGELITIQYIFSWCVNSYIKFRNIQMLVCYEG